MTSNLKAKPGNPKVGLLALLASVALNLKLVGGFLLKGGWLLKTGLTGLVSYVVYGSVYGWRFALAMGGMLVIHEFGHWIWLKGNGVAAEVPIFIPFVGAIISLKKLPENSVTTAWTALAGPLIGGAGALICWLLGVYLNNGPLMAGGSFGFMLNLFQLVPAMPLDGGWVLASISKKLLFPGTLFLILLTILSRSPLMAIICIIAVVSLFSKKKTDPAAALPGQTLADLERELVGNVDLKSGQKSAGEVVSAPGSGRAKKTIKKIDLERCAIFAAYLILTGLLGFMSVDSITVMNARLHISNPVAYLRGH